MFMIYDYIYCSIEDCRQSQNMRDLSDPPLCLGRCLECVGYIVELADSVCL